MSELLISKIAKKMAVEMLGCEIKPVAAEITSAKPELPLKSPLLEKYIAVQLAEQREIQKAEQKLLEIRKWLQNKEINPHYEPYNNYAVNCGSCAFVLWSRLNGHNLDAEAPERNIACTIENMELLTGLKQELATPESIEKLLRARGPMSHVIVAVQRSRGSGHWFNAYFDGKRVWNLDAQIGEIHPWPRDYGDVVQWKVLV